MTRPVVLAAGPAVLDREAAVKVAEILDQLREQATSANGADGWDQVSIPTLLDCCGFVAPTVEGPEDQSERQIRALNTLGDLSGKLSPSRREVFQRSARLYMTESWGWTTYEADHAVKNVCRRHEVEKLAPTNGWCDMNKLKTFESPPALIGDVIAEKAFVVMYGPYSSGKTFISLDMALSLATGTSWHGADVRQGAVAYVLGEGLGGIGARVTAWREAHGAPSDTPFRLLPQAVEFGSPAAVADLIASIATWTTELRFLVIDTMFRCFVGNENSPEDVGAFVGGIDRCRQEMGCAVLLLHHPGLTNTDRSRGHSALEQALDQVIKIERNKDTGLITMSCAKNRDGLLFGKRQFRLSPRAQSMVVETADLQIAPSAESALAALHRIAAWDGASHGAWYKAAGQPNVTFSRALKTLQDGDYVEKSDEDQYQVTDAGCALLGVST